jgi:hypothetical protein
MPNSRSNIGPSGLCKVIVCSKRGNFNFFVRMSFFADTPEVAEFCFKPGGHLMGSSVIRKDFELKDTIGLPYEHGARQCKAERVRLHDGESLSLQGADHGAYIRDIEAMFDHYVERQSAGRKPMEFRLSSKILQLPDPHAA